MKEERNQCPTCGTTVKDGKVIEGELRAEIEGLEKRFLELKEVLRARAKHETYQNEHITTLKAKLEKAKEVLREVRARVLGTGVSIKIEELLKELEGEG